MTAIETWPEVVPFLNQRVMVRDPTSVVSDAPATLLTSTCEPIAPRYGRFFHDDVGRTGVVLAETTVVVVLGCVVPELPPVVPSVTPLVPPARSDARVVEVEVVVVGGVALSADDEGNVSRCDRTNNSFCS